MNGTVRQYRQNQLLKQLVINNLTTIDGRTHALHTAFHGSGQVVTWYIGLINASGYTGILETDTYASHSGWTEATTYSEGARQAWTEGASSAQKITSSSPSVFTITGAITLKGIFISERSQKGEVSGSTRILWSMALFASDLALVADDSLEINYFVDWCL